MTSEGTWFNFGKPVFEEADRNKFVYRYISFDSLLQMLNERVIILVQTSYWEDAYENFIVKEKYFNDKQERIPVNWLSKMFYGQCWTGKMSSDAMWRIYSPDKKGVRIRTRIGKVLDVLSDEPSCFLGRVEYLPQSKIEEDLLSLNGHITENQLCRLMLESQFVKRNSFSHESEFRIIKMLNWSPREAEPTQRISIDPFSFIENVLFDPRADQTYVERCKNILVNSFNYPAKRIKQSSLYTFTPLVFKLEKELP